MDEMNKFDLSIPIGIGYEFGNNFGLGFRVVPGLNDITKDENEKDTNFVVSLGVSCKFGKKKEKYRNAQKATRCRAPKDL